MMIQMNELNGNEKYYYLDYHLPTDAQAVRLWKLGSWCCMDLLYSFIYEDFQTTYRYTRLGYVAEISELSEAFGGGGVTISFRFDEVFEW